jgi:hypothetical protein
MGRAAELAPLQQPQQQQQQQLHDGTQQPQGSGALGWVLLDSAGDEERRAMFQDVFAAAAAPRADDADGQGAAASAAAQLPELPRAPDAAAAAEAERAAAEAAAARAAYEDDQVCFACASVSVDASVPVVLVSCCCCCCCCWWSCNSLRCLRLRPGCPPPPHQAALRSLRIILRGILQRTIQQKRCVQCSCSHAQAYVHPWPCTLARASPRLNTHCT